MIVFPVAANGGSKLGMAYLYTTPSENKYEEIILSHLAGDKWWIIHNGCDVLISDSNCNSNNDICDIMFRICLYLCLVNCAFVTGEFKNSSNVVLHVMFLGTDAWKYVHRDFGDLITPVAFSTCNQCIFRSWTDSCINI